MKISYKEFMQAVTAPCGEPLPFLRRAGDSPATVAGLPRAAAEMRLAGDCFITGSLKGLLSPALGAAGLARIVWQTPALRPLILPAASVGAVGGCALGLLGLACESVRGTSLAIAAGSNVVYEAGAALFGGSQNALVPARRKLLGGPL